MRKKLGAFLVSAAMLLASVLPAAAFSDVQALAWYSGYVERVNQMGLMSGVGGDCFEPERTVTRSEMVQVLYNMEGKPAVSAAHSGLADVSGTDWFYPAVQWAYTNGVTAGVDSTHFAPGGQTTREQLVTLIWNYYKRTGADWNVHEYDLSGYRDLSSVSGWAIPAMKWAVKNGIVSGVSASELAPQKECTRAELATILVKFSDRINDTFDPAQIPEFSGDACIVIHGNDPYFTEEERDSLTAFETYTPLDALGRCGAAYANVCTELMPTEDRGSIGSVKPTGWHTVKYDCVEGKYLYNRCHLIGYQLTAENANECNLITGTRYLNVSSEGMLPFENMVADYVKETNRHVLYRVTPVFDGTNLVAKGVLMEGWSVEDDGAGVEYCVFCYNIQPGITIDYATGESWENSGTAPLPTEPTDPIEPEVPEESEAMTAYVVNTKTKKYHRPDCRYVSDIHAENRLDVMGSHQTMLAQGYEPCKVCNP